METETALVRSYSAVELYSITSVYSYVAVIVDPRYSEHDLSFGLHDSLYDIRVDEFGMLFDNRLERLQNLFDGLNEFGLTCVVSLYLIDYALKILIGKFHNVYSSKIYSCIYRKRVLRSFLFEFSTITLKLQLYSSEKIVGIYKKYLYTLLTYRTYFLTILLI